VVKRRNLLTKAIEKKETTEVRDVNPLFSIMFR
jgi:hypothetical protein